MLSVFLFYSSKYSIEFPSEWYLMALICISLMTKDPEHLFTFIGHLFISFCIVICSNLSIFSLFVYFWVLALFICRHSFYILDINILSHNALKSIFSQTIYCSFIFIEVSWLAGILNFNKDQFIIFLVFFVYLRNIYLLQICRYSPMFLLKALWLWVSYIGLWCKHKYFLCMESIHFLPQYLPSSSSFIQLF